MEPIPSLEMRMQWFEKNAATLSLQAIRDCMNNFSEYDITHLITVSCTGMSAPGLDLELTELLSLSKNIHRTSVNFMGCYAAIHAMKMADAFCQREKDTNVLIVCTELCTLHFQNDPTQNNITSSMLFGDGAAAMLITNNKNARGLTIDNFYSSVDIKGKKDMAWELSSRGFLMTLSGFVPDLIEIDFNPLVSEALSEAEISREQITHWCIHPGGKKILEAVIKSLSLTNGQLDNSYEVLKDFGNMSSPTILFVLKKIMQTLNRKENNKIFGAAFGPGITMETFILSS
jgi:predicted naringenin-chalcone synthase